MNTVSIAVKPFQAEPAVLSPVLPEITQFPVVTGTINELNGYWGDIPKANSSDTLGLHKTAHQHHRSAIVTISGDPFQITDEKRQLLVSAKGASMSRPHIGLTSDTDRKAYPYTFGMVSSAELGDQFQHMVTLHKAGVGTEKLVGCLEIGEYLLDGERLTLEEFATISLARYTDLVKGLNISHAEKAKREADIQQYAAMPHVIILRATESALRLADLQDEPQVHRKAMLDRARASGEPGLENLTLPDYFSWLQQRLGANVLAMQKAGFVHRVLYHGGNITTNGEIVDLDTLRRREAYPSEAEFEKALQQDVIEVARNIKLLQKAFRYNPDASTFLDYMA